MSDDPTDPDEGSTYPNEESAPDDPDAGHDDIMKRLVDYQRQLREGVEPTEAAAVAWHREPRDPVPTEPSEPSAEPAQPEEPAPRGEPDLVDVSTRGSEIQTEAEATSGEGGERGLFDQPPDRVEVLSSEEAEASPARPWERSPAPGPQASRTDVSDRIAQLEGTLDRLSTLLGDLRENFQGMAVTADERLAAIEAEIESNRERPNDPS